MISLASGILVTKASNEADMSAAMVGQLFSAPRVLYMVGGSMVVMGIVTPLNAILFSAYGLAFIVSGRAIQAKLEVVEIEEEVSEEEAAADEIRKPENVASLLHVDPIELEFGYGIIPLADASQGGDLLDRVVLIVGRLL